MRIEIIRPSKSFHDAEEVVALAHGYPEDLALLYSMDLPALPVLLNDCDLPYDLPNQFISHVALIRATTTGRTAGTYAECLLNWLRYLKKKEWELKDATEEKLAGYRNSLMSSRGIGGTRKYTPATINLRVSVVAIFYAWLLRRRLLLTPLGEFSCDRYTLPRYKGENGHRAKSPNSLMVPRQETLPAALGFEQLARILSITPQPYRLIFRWGLVTGIRRFEVANLRYSALMPADQIASSGLDPIPVDILRKGGKTATVYAPAALLEETHWYFLVDRPRPANDEDSDYVFLSQRSTPFTPGTLSRTFRKYADSAGTSATLHHLRHSFAILCLGYLEALERKGKQINPVKIVQTLLSHANVTTTEVYLRTLQVSSDEVRDALGFLYGITK